MNALIVAHYHESGLLRTDTIDLLTHIQQHFKKIILVSTHLLEAEKYKLPPEVQLIIRENIGYDFFSYRQGLIELKKDTDLWTYLTTITMMNTSFVCFDTHKLFKAYFQQTALKNFEAMGLIKSRQIKPHLQSYLFTCQRKVFDHPNVSRWWQEMTPINDRARVIMELEIGFSQVLRQSRIHLKGVYERPLVVKLSNLFKAAPLKLLKILKIRHYNKVRNIMFADFMKIYHRYGIVKIELLKKNTFNQNMTQLYQHIKSSPTSELLLQEALNN